jgi:uncharacterized glyoxalase superfamily protein PhnB
MQLQPYLYFNGDCEVAFKFYERDGRAAGRNPRGGVRSPPEYRFMGGISAV